jgi:hypothetical protein
MEPSVNHAIQHAAHALVVELTIALYVLPPILLVLLLGAITALQILALIQTAKHV